MKLYNVFIPFIIILMMSCSVSHEPIVFGKDACENCKMLIMDPKFGAVLTTQKGKNFKFDDLNCLASYIHQKAIQDESVFMISVMDFKNPGSAVDIKNALFVLSDKVKSPMASGIASFSERETYEEFISDSNGLVITWPEIKTKFR